MPKEWNLQHGTCQLVQIKKMAFIQDPSLGNPVVDPTIANQMHSKPIIFVKTVILESYIHIEEKVEFLLNNFYEFSTFSTLKNTDIRLSHLYLIDWIEIFSSITAYKLIN